MALYIRDFQTEINSINYDLDILLEKIQDRIFELENEINELNMKIEELSE